MPKEYPHYIEEQVWNPEVLVERFGKGRIEA